MKYKFIALSSSFLIATLFIGYLSGYQAYAESFTIDSLKLEEATPNIDPPLPAAYFKIGLKEAWKTINDLNPDLSAITIGIIYTGIESIHPEFAGQKVNGDFLGTVDLGNTPENVKIDAGEIIDGELESHGTNVAGIIGANNISATSSDNYVPPHMNGVLSGAKNLNYTLENRGKKDTLFSTFKNIFELSSNGAQIINISSFTFFTPATPIFSTVFFIHSDILFVVSSGNNDRPVVLVTPANLGGALNVIAVGATTLEDKRADTSNHGPAIGISAPGEFVLSPTFFTEPLSTEDYEGFSGTSASAPLVTGVAGLLKAINPDLTPSQIKDILISTGDPISTDKPIGPRLNALNAVCHPLVLDCPKEIAEPPWSQFQHDARHTGQSPFQGPQTDNVKWSFTPPITPGFIGTPVVGPNETIYFGSGSQSQGRLFALNPDGTLKWQSSLLRAAPTNPAIITDGMVIIVVGTQDFGTDVAAIDEDGNTLWTFPIENRVDFVTLSKDKTLYITNENGFLFSLTPTETGVTENWRTDLGGIAILRSSPTVGENGTVYVIDHGGTFQSAKLFAINPTDGTTLWTRTFSGRSASSALILDEGTVVVATPSNLRGFNPTDGTDVFIASYTFGRPTVPILLPDGNIGVVVKESGGNGTLHRINPTTQTIASSFPLGPVLNIRIPVVDNQGTIYIAADIVSDVEDRIANPATLFAVSSTNTLVFTKTFLILPKNLAIGSTGVLYVPAIDVVNETELVDKMVAIGE